MKPLKILSIDDADRGAQYQIVRHLSSTWEVELANSFASGLVLLRSKPFDVLLLDRHLEAEHLSGIDLIEGLKFEFPNLAILILTYDSDFNGIPRAFELGASDYLIKSSHLISDLQIRIPEAVKRIRSHQVLTISNLQIRFNDCPLIGNSKFISIIYRQIMHIAERNFPVFLNGPEHSGIKTIAEGIWRASNERFRPFYHVDLALFSRAEHDRLLFGNLKIDSSLSEKRGAFLLADGGDLFLENIDLLDRSLQAKLIEVLLFGTISLPDSQVKIRVKTRIIASSPKVLEREVATGNFSEVLCRELTAHRITVPSLSERKEDIPVLVHSILSGLPQKDFSVSEEALSLLMSQSLPGNYQQLVTVLKNTVNLLASLKKGHIDAFDIFRANEFTFQRPTQIRNEVCIPSEKSEVTPESYRACINDAERCYLSAALLAFNWDLRALAPAMGLSLSAIYRRLDFFNLEKGNVSDVETGVPAKKRGRKKRGGLEDYATN
jgi:DNA-binding NtrC family response regulator